MKGKMKKEPAIRFKGYTDVWEQRKLGEVVTKAVDNRGKTPPTQDLGSYPLLEIASLGKATPDYSKVTKYVDEDTYNNWFRGHIEKDDILFSTVGNTGLVTLMDDYEGATIAQNIVALRSKEGNNPKFLLQMFQLPENLKRAKRIEMGAVQPSIKVSQLVHVGYLLPLSEQEQEEIGSFFSQLDHLITLQQRELDLMKRAKKTLLSKMFPKNGELFPELRFKGYTDAWEQRKFRDILRSHPYRSYLADGSEVGQYEVIQQGDKPFVGYADGAPFVEFDSVTLFGDHTVSLYKPQEPFFVATDGVKILSADNFEGNYLYTTLECYKPDPQGYKRHFTILKNQDVWFTENKNEQSEIGTFFSTLDHLITLQQRQQDLMKILKKTLLKEMFI